MLSVSCSKTCTLTTEDTPEIKVILEGTLGWS